MSVTVTRRIKFNGGGTAASAGDEPTRNNPEGRVPRISRLMALAIHMQRLLDEGVARDRAELARLAHVSRARITQIMNLLNLAPDIQEEILFLPRTERGRDPIDERAVRSIAAALAWSKQRGRWQDTNGRV